MTSARITFEVRGPNMAKLKALVSRTGKNQSDIVNRAIELLEYVESEARKGKEVIIRDKKGGEQAVKFL